MPDDLDNIDLDEDLFGFEAPSDVAQDADDEEDLEAIFAAFQAQDDAEKAAEAEVEAAPPKPAPKQRAAEAPAARESASSSASAAINESLDDEGDADAFEFHSVPSSPKRKKRAAKSETGATPAGGTPRPQRVAGIGGVASKSTLLILVSVTTLNALVALVSLKYGADIRDSVVQTQREFANTTDRLQSDARDAAVELIESRTPLVPPDPESHPTFERATDAISRGDYTEARQRLYALLSVVDRLEESQRRVVEARAQFLIARATHLEAIERAGGER